MGAFKSWQISGKICEELEGKGEEQRRSEGKGEEQSGSGGRRVYVRRLLVPVRDTNRY